MVSEQITSAQSYSANGSSAEGQTHSKIQDPKSKIKIGVLALQGDFAEHIAILRRLGAEVVEVRRPEQLVDIDGLIIPGGESTAMGRLAGIYGLKEPINRLATGGFPVYGTCAGMIMLSRDIGDTAALMEGKPQSLFDVMDIKVKRNAFGRQLDSFETTAPIKGVDGGPFPMIFIRAPYIESVGDGVEVLATLPDGGPIVAARQDNLLVSAFHPELTDDTRFHQLFLEMVAESSQGK